MRSFASKGYFHPRLAFYISNIQLSPDRPGKYVNFPILESEMATHFATVTVEEHINLGAVSRPAQPGTDFRQPGTLLSNLDSFQICDWSQAKIGLTSGLAPCPRVRPVGLCRRNPHLILFTSIRMISVTVSPLHCSCHSGRSSQEEEETIPYGLNRFWGGMKCSALFSGLSSSAIKGSGKSAGDTLVRVRIPSLIRDLQTQHNQALL